MSDVYLAYDTFEREPYPHKLTPHNERAYWPGGANTPPYSETERQLYRELEHLGANTAVVLIDTDRDGFRRDGGIRHGAKVGHPGVVLDTGTRHGPLQFATDRYRIWTDNVRAITLALEGLRRLDRYGITRSGQQYQGWRALPAGESGPDENPAPMSRTEATKIVCELGNAPGLADMWALLNKEVRTTVIRTAQRNTHPDTGGNAEQFTMLTQALEVLGA